MVLEKKCVFLCFQKSPKTRFLTPFWTIFGKNRAWKVGVFGKKGGPVFWPVLGRGGLPRPPQLVKNPVLLEVYATATGGGSRPVFPEWPLFEVIFWTPKSPKTHVGTVKLGSRICPKMTKKSGIFGHFWENPGQVLSKMVRTGFDLFYPCLDDWAFFTFLFYCF